MNGSDELLREAEEILALLRRHRVDAVVIGAVALAAHHYVRMTDDLNLGVNANVATLREIAASLREAGRQVELREPDQGDPLGGVIDVRSRGGLIQIISYADRFPAVIDDALRLSTLPAQEGSALRIVPLPHLIALKLYAGGFKSKADIVELLIRNPKLDLAEVRAVCARYQLDGIEELIEESRSA